MPVPPPPPPRRAPRPPRSPRPPRPQRGPRPSHQPRSQQSSARRKKKKRKRNKNKSNSRNEGKWTMWERKSAPRKQYEERKVPRRSGILRFRLPEVRDSDDETPSEGIFAEDIIAAPKMIRSISAPPPSSQDESVAVKKETSIPAKGNNLVCAVCSITYPNEKLLSFHLKGEKHKKMLELVRMKNQEQHKIQSRAASRTTKISGRKKYSRMNQQVGLLDKMDRSGRQMGSRTRAAQSNDGNVNNHQVSKSTRKTVDGNDQAIRHINRQSTKTNHVASNNSSRKWRRDSMDKRKPMAVERTNNSNSNKKISTFTKKKSSNRSEKKKLGEATSSTIDTMDCNKVQSSHRDQGYKRSVGTGFRTSTGSSSRNRGRDKVESFVTMHQPAASHPETQACEETEQEASTPIDQHSGAEITGKETSEISKWNTVHTTSTGSSSSFSPVTVKMEPKENSNREDIKVVRVKREESSETESEQDSELEETHEETHGDFDPRDTEIHTQPNRELWRIRAWGVKEVQEFLEACGLSNLKPSFSDHGITGERMLHIDADVLESKFRVGPTEREQFLLRMHEIIWSGSQDLPSLWQYATSEGDIYYYRTNTRETQWEKPKELLEELRRAGVIKVHLKTSEGLSLQPAVELPAGQGYWPSKVQIRCYPNQGEVYFNFEGGEETWYQVVGLRSTWTS